MKLAMIAWLATFGFAYYVAGPSLELGLLSAKVTFAGLVLGAIAWKISDALEAARNVKQVLRRYR